MLYSEPLLLRQLKLVESFSSSAMLAPTPMKMVERIASPFYMSKLLGLLVIASPKVKQSIALIFSNLVRMKLPYEVFEEAINMLQE
jgi:hypothetical protein